MTERLRKLCRKKKGQLRNSEIHIKEHLTARNHTIHYHVRQARDYGILHHIWTDNGRVWGIVKEGDNPMILRDAEYLDSVVKQAIADGILKKSKCGTDQRAPK